MSQPALVITCVLVSAATAALTVYALSQVRSLPALDPRTQMGAAARK